MAEPDPTPRPAAPQATVHRSRRLHLPYVWIVPLIAALVGGYLFWRTEIDVGPTIEIAFADGVNIGEGAKVVYRGVQVGSVQSVELDADLQHVNVVVQLHKPAAGLAREGSQFWIVTPRISLGQVTGLETLLSGSYIEAAPGSGPEATQFVGLAAPPVLPPNERDLVIFLEADEAASLGPGSPVSYRGITVGNITAVDLPQDGSRVQLQAAIAATHASLVRANSVFWLTSGVHFDLRPLDPKIDISSVESLIRGGVAFATPGPPGAPASDNALFELLGEPPPDSVIAPRQGLHVVLTAAELDSVAVGDPVYYREVQVGEVSSVGLERDARAAQADVLIWQRYAPLVQEGTMFWNASGLRFRASLFGGARLDLESLAALLGGGVAFATPDQGGTPAKNGSRFVLHDKPKDEWLQWQPDIELAPATPPIELAEGFSVQDLAPADYTVTTTSHVREGPDTTYPVLTTLDQGTSIPVTGKVEGRDWYRVAVGDAAGYIWGKLVQPAPAAAAQ